MAIKVTVLFEEMVEKLNSKIEVELAEQDSLQTVLTDCQEKMDASLQELADARTMLDNLQLMA